MAEIASLLAAMRGEITPDAAGAALGMTAAELHAAVQADLRRRLPPPDLALTGMVAAPVIIQRDGFGIPHITATTTPDLCFGLGVAMAQDRLWQMDLFRRRGQGRLAEVLGPAHYLSDLTHRTLDTPGLAAQDEALFDEETAATMAAFVAGINRVIATTQDGLPVEFDLLGYAPAPWSVTDVLAAARGFWWLLNGRLASIVVGEAAERFLPAGALRDAFLTPDYADVTIVPGSGAPVAGAGTDASVAGSNNWAIGAARTAGPAGAGILSSDPHQPFAVPANWYECRLRGPDDDLAGAAWAGMPGLFFGRNRRIAWGLTNNNVSLRDLYVEAVNPASDAEYRTAEGWRPFTQREETIAVRGEPARTVTIRATERGPIVNDLIPALDPLDTTPVSLRWVGLAPLANIGPLLRMNRAATWEEFRAALAPWPLPTFNWGFADRAGHAAYQCASHVPVRGRSTRGLRDATNPDDAWQGFIPYDAMPRIEPTPEFIVSANNPTVGSAYPYPFAGAFASGERAARITAILSQAPPLDADACRRLQLDTYSLHADRLCGALLARLGDAGEPALALFIAQLTAWNNQYALDQTGPVFYEMFMRHWARQVAAARFPAHLAGLVTGQGRVVAELLVNDALPWFAAADKNALIRETVREAVAAVRERFGDDPAGWAWGTVHLAHFRHPLSNELLAPYLDHGPAGIPGAMTTVRNTGLGDAPLFHSTSGAEYQLVADLGDDTAVLANQSQGQSGQPGSPHYGDQFPHFVAGTYHTVALDLPPEDVTARVRITPA